MSNIIKQLFFSGIMLLFITACSDEQSRPGSINCPLEQDPQFSSSSNSLAYQQILDQYIRRGLPGAILLVKDESGFFIGSAGVADIKNKVNMQACHVSKIASVTKLMFATAVLKLSEEGVLSLNDPVSKYIPSEKLRKLSNGDQPITIRNLLNHTSGFYDIIEDQNFYLHILNDPERHWTSDELLEFAYNKPAAFGFSPADTVGYSNTNYLLLSMIVESATGIPHANTLRTKIFETVGMNDTYYYWHDPYPSSGVAQGYFDLYNNGNLQNLSLWNTGSGNGYGGVYSTVWDMYLFMDALFVSKTLLSQASLNEMLVFHPDVESRKLIGTGCFKDFIDLGDTLTDYAWGHRGRDLAYSADLYYFPEYHTIMALMVNYGTDGNSSLKPVYNEMRDQVARVVMK